MQVCQLLDFGVDSHFGYLVLPRFASDLSVWRLRQQGTPASMLPRFLRIFLDVVGAVQVCPATHHCRHNAHSRQTLALLSTGQHCLCILHTRRRACACWVACLHCARRPARLAAPSI